MARIQRKAVLLYDGGIPTRLDAIYMLANETSRRVAATPRFQGFLRAIKCRGKGSRGRRVVEVEAEERVGEEIVERRPGAIPVIG
jgi:hypothetical protein